MESIKETIYLIRNKKIFSSNTYIFKNIINISYTTLCNALWKFFIIILYFIFIKIFIIYSAAYFKNKHKIPFYLHEGDIKIAQSANFFLKIAQLEHKIETPKPDFLFRGELDYLILNNIGLEIYNFPGHSPGSCIIKIENNLFSGDIFYRNGLGKGSVPKENTELLRQSILKIFSVFLDENLVLPGHGSPEYLGIIIENNSELKDFLFRKL